MQRFIGRTGISVNAIGFGAWPLSRAGRPDEEQAIAVILAAVDAGVDLIDTADAYCLDDGETGHNERLIAKALTQRPSATVHVATKGGCVRPGGEWAVNGRPKHLRQACERSLKALGQEAIFLYQLHAPDDDVPIEDSVGEMSRLQEEGKILHIGVSNVTTDELTRSLKTTRVETVQNKLNPLCQRDLQNGLLDQCKKENLTYIAYSPVGGEEFSRELGHQEMIDQIADAHQVSPYQIMLAWALSKGDHVLPIPGASKVASILDSVKSTALHLTAAEIQKIDQIEMIT